MGWNTNKYRLQIEVQIPKEWYFCHNKENHKKYITDKDNHNKGNHNHDNHKKKPQPRQPQQRQPQYRQPQQRHDFFFDLVVLSADFARLICLLMQNVKKILNLNIFWSRIDYFIHLIFNRPGVAGAVLKHRFHWSIDGLSKSVSYPFPLNPKNIFTTKP